jgi:hypothetical protein
LCLLSCCATTNAPTRTTSTNNWSPYSDVGLLHFLDPNHPSHEEYEDDVDYNFYSTGFLSLLLGLGTTWLIFFLRGFKNTTFFCNAGTRTSVHDFAVSVAVLVFSLLKGLIFNNIETETLNVPDQFEPTFQCCDASCTTNFPDDCPDQAEPFGTRAWFIDMTDLGGKGWVVFLAAGPAFLAFFLIFLDNGITWHLINHKSHKLQHGEAYNYDLFLSGIFNLVNGLLGLPWLVATTVPCIIHLNGLAEKDKDGKFISVNETRLTALFAHLVMGLSMLFMEVLKLIPVPVLYGVFLFMGLASLPGIQFWNRILLNFRQGDSYPDTVFTKYVSKSKVHMYTLFQCIFFAGVFTVQNIKAIAIGFPLMTLLCIPARLYLLPRFFAGWELLLLDGEDDAIQEWVDAKEASLRNGANLRMEGYEDDDGDESIKKYKMQDGEKTY